MRRKCLGEKVNNHIAKKVQKLPRTERREAKQTLHRLSDLINVGEKNTALKYNKVFFFRAELYKDIYTKHSHFISTEFTVIDGF